MVPVSKEARRKAREALAGGVKVDEEERFGWFIASTEQEFKGLKFLLKEDWRRALKAWKDNKYFNLHNKATLHRALFYSGKSQKPDAHLRECLRLYYFLSEKNPDQPLYRLIQEDMIEHLKESIQDCHRTGDDKAAAKSMKILAQTVGTVGVTNLQVQFFGRDLDKFRIDLARITKELLTYQGVAHAPPGHVLERCDQELTQVVLPEAAKLSRKLIEGSEELTRVEEFMAQACGVMSQSYSKAGEARAAKRWLGEALRWEPGAVTDWRSLPDEDWGDEESAVVKFPEKRQEKDESPLVRGSYAAGVQVVTTHRQAGESREECLETVFLLGIPLFPTRRFACYRNLDTGEVGYYLRIAMTAFDHIRQGVAILLLSFLFTVLALTVMDLTKEAGPDHQVSTEVTQEEIGSKVEELKELAQKEAKLAALSERTPEQEKQLKKLRAERMAVIKELEALEKQRGR